MTIQDQSGAAHSSTLLAEGNEISLESGGNMLTGEDHVPKIRKPYTISKQRERWTEEEHEKFLEALKLYGRAWRKIEEHIGTKSAVQIRSHAQKFFSKVVRESCCSDPTSIKPTEIPPPRAKRKPTHPYPRKFVPSAKKERPVQEQSARSTSLNSTVDQEGQSPTSVLSADTNTLVGSSSPMSSIDDVNPAVLPPEDDPSRQENSTQFDEPVSVQKLELIPKVDTFEKEGLVEATSTKSLKLFGKTLSLPDSDKPATSSPSCNKSISSETNEGSAPELANFAAVNAENPPGQHLEVEPSAVLPWWSFYGGIPFSFIRQNVVGHASVHLQDKELRKEGSLSSLDTCYKKLGAATPSHEYLLELINAKKDMDPASQLFSNAKISSSPERNTRGFVPYKRSLSTVTCEENETHRFRLRL